MKKIILLFSAVFALNTVNSQEVTSEELDMIQEFFGNEKREIIAENIDLTGVNEGDFWKLYDEYEEQRQDLGRARLKLLKKYTTQKGALTNAQAQDLLAEAVPLRNAEDKLILSYTKRIEKAANALVSVQFYQIEHYISDGVRFAILDNVDFIQDKQ